MADDRCPRFDLAAPRASDVMHFNRVEGLYTGAGVKWTLRDRAPGVVVRANAGYAWAEQTVRGRLQATRTRGPWTLEARGGRSLDNTNDFRVPFDSGDSFGAFFASLDPYDYVSRSSATLGLVRTLGARRAIIRTEVGVGDDRYRPSHMCAVPSVAIRIGPIVVWTQGAMCAVPCSSNGIDVAAEFMHRVSAHDSAMNVVMARCRGSVWRRG